jgi:hypothetical protein
MRKILIAGAVVAMTAQSAYAQSGFAMSGFAINVAPVTNVSTQLNVAVPTNASPATAVAVSLNGSSVAKAATFNFQNVAGINQAKIGQTSSFITGF